MHRNGSAVWVRVRISLVRDSAGNPCIHVVHIEDITERKRAEEALRESEERFRIMADGCPSAMWVTDAEGGVQFVNRAFRELLGISYEEAQGAGWQMVVHPDDLPAYTEVSTGRFGSTSPSGPKRVSATPHGEWRWVASHAEPRFSPNGTYLGHVGISPDITDRKRAEEALRAAREAAEQAARHHEFQHSLIRAIHEGSPDGILPSIAKRSSRRTTAKFLDIWRITAPIRR
jgi:PAS domain S-box-containing protein